MQTTASPDNSQNHLADYVPRVTLSEHNSTVTSWLPVPEGNVSFNKIKHGRTNPVDTISVDSCETSP